MVQKHGLTCAMTSAGLGIADGFNRLENHDELVAGLEKIVPMAAEAEMPSIPEKVSRSAVPPPRLSFKGEAAEIAQTTPAMERNQMRTD